MSKKGKIFKTIDCAMSGLISSMHFSANRLVVADLRVCKCFVDWREAWSVPLKDQITAFATGPLNSASDTAYIIASRDRALRVRASQIHWRTGTRCALSPQHHTTGTPPILIAIFRWCARVGLT